MAKLSYVALIEHPNMSLVAISLLLDFLTCFKQCNYRFREITASVSIFSFGTSFLYPKIFAFVHTFQNPTLSQYMVSEVLAYRIVVLLFYCLLLDLH